MATNILYPANESPGALCILQGGDPRQQPSGDPITLVHQDTELVSDADEVFVGSLDDEGASHSQDIPGTFAFYHRRRYQPLFEGATYTLIQAVFILQMQRFEKYLTDEAFKAVIIGVHSFLPEGNIFPRTLHFIDKLVGLGSLEDAEMHACPCHKHRYAKVERRCWDIHRDDSCPKCGLTRFITVRSSMQPRLVGAHLAQLH
jgi:hypothetical protein